MAGDPQQVTPWKVLAKDLVSVESTCLGGLVGQPKECTKMVKPTLFYFNTGHCGCLKDTDIQKLEDPFTRVGPRVGNVTVIMPK